MFRTALFLPLFEELADPRAVVALAVEAEAAGWDGVFVWDHVRFAPPVQEVGDPWVTLSAVAAVTSRIRFGPLVTPLARRRPVKLARETAALDLLSGGRLVLGVGLGSDRFGEEFSRTGEELDDRTRAQMLDESLDVLGQAWSGETLHHKGPHYTVDGVRFLPRPVQRPGVPVWVAGFPGNRAPLRRAARHEGFFPVNLDHPDQVAQIHAELCDLRGDVPFDLVIALPAATDPAPFAAAGATWCLTEFEPGVTVDSVRGVLREGPPGVERSE